jgi:hypothetical protein
MDRTTTPRTLREAFGQDVRLHDSHPALRWPKPELLAMSLVAAVAAWAIAGLNKDAELLRLQKCQYVAQTLDGEHIWHCRDGWRVNDTPGNAL